MKVVKVKSGQRGSVSIFLLIILVALIIFNLVLLDLARIYIAKQQTEGLVKTGLRSTLANFDLELYERYGLLGVYDSKALYNLQQNIIENHRRDGLLGLEIVEISSFRLKDSLAESEVFSRQIMERMKYQAPLQLSTEVLSLLTPFDIKLSEAVNQMETILDAQKWYDDRLKHMQLLQNKLNEMLEITGKGRETVSQLREQYSQIEADMSSLRVQLNRLVEQDEESQQKRAQILAALERLQFDLQNNELTAQHLLSNYLQQAFGIYNQLVASIDSMEYANEMIRFILDQHQQKALIKFEDSLGLVNILVDDSDERDTDMLEEAEEIIYPSQLFVQLKDTDQDFNSKLQLLEQGYSDMNTLDWIFLERSFFQLTEYVVELKRGITGLLESAIEREEQVASIREVYEAEGEQIINQLKLLIGELLPTVTPQDEYIHSLYKLYVQEDLEEELKLEELSLATLVELTAGMFASLASELNSQQASFSEQLYINQYMFTYFPSVDPEQITSVLSGSEQITLNQQAIEYIIYGNVATQANLYRGLTELIIFRALLNTPEAIRLCRATIHPLLIFTCTISRMLALSLADIQLLLQGNSVLIHKQRANYRDHLKFINYLHWSNKKIARIQALINTDLEASLFNLYTKAHAEVIGTLPLWVIPDTIQLLDKDSPWQDYTLGYMVTRRATYAY